MIAQSTGFDIGRFGIPPFELNQGELLGICLYGGQHFFDLRMNLVALFTGRKTNPQLVMHQKLHFVEHFKESNFRSLFFPTTVKRYLASNGNLNEDVLKRLYELDKRVRPATKVKSLGGNPRKWLSLFATLSLSDKIIFDLSGQDPPGAEQTLEIVKQYVDRGGAAVLLENCEDSEDSCKKFIRVQVNPGQG